MSEPRIRSTAGIVDSIVFIALGPAARSMSLLYALQSLREEGLWDGPIHVIVDEEDDLECLQSHLRQQVSIIVVAPINRRLAHSALGVENDGGIAGRGETLPREEVTGLISEGGGGGEDGGIFVAGGNNDVNIDSMNNSNQGGMIVHAKWAKMKLLDLLPPGIRRLVYIDCDVITQRPVGPFLSAIDAIWREEAADTFAAEGGSDYSTEEKPSRSPSSSSRVSPSPQHDDSGEVEEAPPLLPPAPPSTLVIFPDAAGHTIPWCWGCDVAHSGVLALARGRSERCLQLWQDAFVGGGEGGNNSNNKGTATDQEALDIAIREGSGCKAKWIDTRHLHFMKDAFVMAGLTRTSTFAHFTGLLHPERLAGIYRRQYEWFLGRSFAEWGAGVIEACSVD